MGRRDAEDAEREDNYRKTGFKKHRPLREQLG